MSYDKLLDKMGYGNSSVHNYYKAAFEDALKGVAVVDGDAVNMLGARVGTFEGALEGALDGGLDGAAVGVAVGINEGRLDGETLGDLVGTFDGNSVGFGTGALDGWGVGRDEGFTLGALDGTLAVDGEKDGDEMNKDDGLEVGEEVVPLDDTVPGKIIPVAT